jgi:hypothetical protein
MFCFLSPSSYLIVLVVPTNYYTVYMPTRLCKCRDFWVVVFFFYNGNSGRFVCTTYLKYESIGNHNDRTSHLGRSVSLGRSTNIL